MLSVNSVLIPTEGKDNRLFKFSQLVVYFHPFVNQICLLELRPDKLRKPKPRSLDEIQIAISEGQFRLGMLQPPVEHRLEEQEINDCPASARTEREPDDLTPDYAYVACGWTDKERTAWRL